MVDEIDKRFVLHCWIEAGQYDLDTCIDLMDVADETSLPYIKKVLLRTPPERMPDGRLGLFDTNQACMAALQRSGGYTRAEMLKMAGTWGPAWSEWVATSSRTEKW